MAILEIVQVGHPALRQKARALTSQEILSADFKRLIEDMRETMRAAPGVGLAAPQVGLPIQVAVMEDEAAVEEEDAKERERFPVPFHVMVNPILYVEDPGPVTFYEGCLSLSGYAAQVPRARAVRIEALNEHGAPVTLKGTGWYARILQHEYDHLQGAMYIDRMDTRSFREV
jgi:peptide deformylase